MSCSNNNEENNDNEPYHRIINPWSLWNNNNKEDVLLKDPVRRREIVNV